jgi:tRNA (cytidine32/uridine32-2'-O)-methyltransferase
MPVAAPAAVLRWRSGGRMNAAMARIDCVLVRPQHPGNIGAAARALRTMGLSRLLLVAPRRFPDAEASALAAGADALLDAAPVHATLDAALAGCTLALGLSARRRGVSLDELDPRAGATRAFAHAAAGGRVALLFGNERTGLENDELARCHAMVRIPSVDDFSSLNLAQAVQLMAYELRLCALAAAPDAVATDAAPEPPAGLHEVETFFAHLWRTLDAIDFHKGRAPHTVERRLRRLFLRAQPSLRELRILHGVLADAERMAQLAQPRSAQGE